MVNQRRLRPERELLPDDLDPDDDRERPLDDDLLTLRPPDERPTLPDLDEERETLWDLDDERDDFETFPGDFEDREDLETVPEERGARDDDLEAFPDDLDDRDDEPDTLPDDLELDPNPREASDPEDPERELLPEDVSPLLRSAGLSEVVLGYHSTPPRFRVVVRVPLEVPEDLVVERVPDLDTRERSMVRPPSVYLPLETVAVLVLTLVALRVVLRAAERVVLRVSVRASERDTAPEVLPAALRPTRTFPSSGSEPLDAERARS